MRLQCSKNKDKYKQSDCIKARNHTLLDFLHLSRNRYTLFLNKASNAGMSHWTWWLLTLVLQGRLYRALQPKLYATRNFCMRDFLKLHHNCDAYMGVQTEPKSTTLKMHLNIGKKGLAACLLHNIDIAVVSECLCHLRAQHPVQSPDICSG